MTGRSNCIGGLLDFLGLVSTVASQKPGGRTSQLPVAEGKSQSMKLKNALLTGLHADRNVGWLREPWVVEFGWRWFWHLGLCSVYALRDSRNNGL